MILVRSEIIAQDLDRIVKRYETEKGTSPASLNDLVKEGYLERIPDDPLGGTYKLNPATGLIESSSAERLKIHRKK